MLKLKFQENKNRIFCFFLFFIFILFFPTFSVSAAAYVSFAKCTTVSEPGGTATTCVVDPSRGATKVRFSWDIQLPPPPLNSAWAGGVLQGYETSRNYSWSCTGGSVPKGDAYYDFSDVSKLPFNNKVECTRTTTYYYCVPMQTPVGAPCAPNRYVGHSYSYDSGHSSLTVILANLNVSCSASPVSPLAGQSVNFSSAVSGSKGSSYDYSWSGACSGKTASCSTSFSGAGYESANVTVTFGPQGGSAACSVFIFLPCELPFASIASNLNASKFTAITESSFRDWASSESTSDSDYVNWPKNDANQGLGSGNKSDIKMAMAQLQAGGCGLSTAEAPLLNALDNLVANKNWPSAISILIKVNSNYAFHRIIALSAAKVGERYQLDVLDPAASGPKTYQLTDCHMEQNETYGSMSMITCSSPVDGQAVIAGLINYQSLIGSFNSHCQNPAYANSKFCKDRSVNLSSWLSQNYPNIPNFQEGINGNTVSGNCAGWTDFILKVAYLGDFVGTDYHPTDGKVVGKDCDANHYPK